jgi:hypothetical protein
MKKIIFLIIAAALVYGFLQERGISIPAIPFSVSSSNSDIVLQNAYNNRESNLQVKGKGVVIRMLSDDLQGSQHQRFILQLDNGQTILISHNIDLAPRINGLKSDDIVEFYGEYEWNSKGGVIHWTHHDPSKRHVAGWLKHEGRTYQ